MRCLILVGLVCAVAAASFGAAAESLGASAEPLAAPTALQRIAVQRAGEALYVAEKASKVYWPTLDPEKVALLIFEPDRWAVLVNHAVPPSGFAASDPLPRFRSPEDLETGDLDPNRPAWSVSLGGPPATAGLRSGSVRIGGVPTAVVRFNEVSIPPASFSGWPPSEAVTSRLLAGLWLAHLDALEGERTIAPTPWSYRAEANDLAHIAIEQRLLAKLLRMQINEKTMERYRRLFSMWLAVRKARLAARPKEVAMEERIERTLGLADFTETVPFKVLRDLGEESRPALEAVDPFFEKYRSFLLLRLNVINYPLTWLPTSPVEALARARSAGAAFAFAVSYLTPRWNLAFLAGDGSRKTLRDVLAAALPLEPGAEAELLDEARKQEGYEALRSVMSEAMERAASLGAQRLPAASAGALLTLRLGAARLTAYDGGPEGFRWLGPEKVEAAGPLRMAFSGGELVSDGGTSLFMEAAPVGGVDAESAGSLAPATVRMALPAGWSLTAGGSRVTLPGPGRRPRRHSGKVELRGGGVSLRLDAAEVTATSAGPEILMVGAPPSQGISGQR